MSINLLIIQLVEECNVCKFDNHVINKIIECCQSVSFNYNQLIIFFLLGLKPTWVPGYSVEGKMIVPYSEVDEPFTAWYDMDSGNSRIDYHNGKFLFVLLKCISK